MTNQSPFFNDQFERVAINIKLENQEILGCFIHIQVELNKYIIILV